MNDGSAQNNLSNAVTATVAITPVNDAPVITSGAGAARVSEEGLTNGVPDTLPAVIDTTNSPSASGTITASDADGDALTMSLGIPSASLTSGGVTIAWTLQDVGHTLIGKAGTATIITATITDAGAYNVTLGGPIDHPIANQEDNKTFTVPVTVSDGHTTTPTTLSVTIEDDSPKTEQVEVSVVATDSKTIPPVTGSVLTGAVDATSNSCGADGGFVQSITVGGGTYNFNPAGNGGVSTSGFGGFTYDGTTKTLTVPALTPTTLVACRHGDDDRRFYLPAADRLQQRVRGLCSGRRRRRYGEQRAQNVLLFLARGKLGHARLWQCHVNGRRRCDYRSFKPYYAHWHRLW